jgi:triacylglycerol lipase
MDDLYSADSSHVSKAGDENVASLDARQTGTAVATDDFRVDHKTKPSNEGDDDFLLDQTSEDEEEVLSIPSYHNASRLLGRRQFSKLEVVNARQIEKLLLWQHVFAGIGILFTVIVVILMRTKYVRSFAPPAWNGAKVFLLFIAPNGLLWFSNIVLFFTFAYSFCLASVYSFRILSLKRRNRTHEQVWVMGLLISLTIFLIPFNSIIIIHDQFLNADVPVGSLRRFVNHGWYRPLSTAFIVLRTSAFTFSTTFYIWASVHSYRLLESDIGIMFYLPKFIILAVYVAARVMVILQYRITPSQMPFASFLGMVATYHAAATWLVPGVVFGVLSLGFELCLGAYILREVVATKHVLKKVDYLNYRTKQIGFRFFVYHNLTFYSVFWALYMTLLLGLPYGLKAFQVFFFQISAFEVMEFWFGIQVMLLAYATVEAYANLPADAIGFKGWFFPQNPLGGGDLSELRPVTYRKREPESLGKDGFSINVNCFVMQTHVTMFNFAWLVYYWDTPKVEDFKLTQDVFSFSVAQYIRDRATDTHALVVDGADRIVIAFKGTTSTKNLKTDMNMFYSNARSLLPSRLGDEDKDGDEEALRNPALQTRQWKWAKVHKGFAIAYAAIGPELLRVIRRLQDEHPRPVYLTGHSLGGALATVCSLDLMLRLGLSRRTIFVSTFGAPRVGNRTFARFYNDMLPIHWRIVVGPDVVAKLPKFGFSHVGKKVLITTDGDLFIDPNSLELKLWSGEVASILYHRKASYLLAMRAWCERHHGDEYVPEFWPFPVSKDDTRRFEHVMVRSVAGTRGPTSAGQYPRRASEKRKRLQEMGDMIEALGGSEGSVDDAVSAAVVAQWSRLARTLQTLEGYAALK